MFPFSSNLQHIKYNSKTISFLIIKESLHFKYYSFLLDHELDTRKTWKKERISQNEMGKKKKSETTTL